MKNRSVLYELNVDLSTKKWSVDRLSDQALIGPVQYGWDRFNKDPESMTFGGGLLAGSPLPGTRRMIFTGYSSQWEGFYVSALGGAMYVFHRVGVNYVWLRGKAAESSILVINFKNGTYSIDIEPINNVDEIWNNYKDTNGREWQGFYALQIMLFEKYRDRYVDDWFRVLALGPAAKNTNFGAIGSNHIKNGVLSVIDDWAGRGGLGSQLFQNHNIAGIVFGGDWQDPALKEAKELDEYFLEHFGQRAIIADLALNEKYRYVPKFETGGTFGVNMHTANDRLLSFNYSSIYASDEARLKNHETFVLDHYLKQFNAETIAPRKFDHCGEPCAIACKKFLGEYKKDYEPYQALGPNCGVYDQRAAEMINKYVDSLGADAITMGGMVSWIMELIREKLLPERIFTYPQEKFNFNFTDSDSGFNVVEDSMKNALFAKEIIEMIIYKPEGEIFRHGIREAAKKLDLESGTRTIDRAVFISHGKKGCMVPNQYWVPGMFSPMPLMGKYFSYYNVDFITPYELGKKNVERFVYEFYSENTGSCRFHRKWVEDIVDEIIVSHFDLDIDFWKNNFLLAKAIHDRQTHTSVFWESERVIDIIKEFVFKWKRDGLENSDLEFWVTKFEADKNLAAREYWEQLMAGINDAFNSSMEEPAHETHGLITK